MNIQEAKNIRLIDFLSGLGYNPVIQRGNDVWYKSPFRTEKEASFKVDLHKEVWYDFGLGKGWGHYNVGQGDLSNTGHKPCVTVY